MTVTVLGDPRIHAKKARLRKLLALRFQVDAEVAALRTELFGRRIAYGPRGEEVNHGTERGYQWHRHQYRQHGAGEWPLPADDPCGCKAAHRAHYYATNGAEKRRQLRRRAEDEEAS